MPTPRIGPSVDRNLDILGQYIYAVRGWLQEGEDMIYRDGGRDVFTPIPEGMMRSDLPPDVLETLDEYGIAVEAPPVSRYDRIFRDATTLRPQQFWVPTNFNDLYAASPPPPPSVPLEIVYTDEDTVMIDGRAYDLTHDSNCPGHLVRDPGQRRAMMERWCWVYNGMYTGRWYERTKCRRISNINIWMLLDGTTINCAYSGDPIPVGSEEVCAFRLSPEGPWVLNIYRELYCYHQPTRTYVLGRARIGGYHANDRIKDRVSQKNPFLIGFEIEKEDETVRADINVGHTELPQGWVAEHDSSLGEGGFEIVTKAYNLKNIQQIHSDMEAASVVLNAEHSRKCGGHINISDYRFRSDRLGTSQFADRIKPLFPLLMALYPQRLLNSYVLCRKFDRLKEERGGNHYSPFCFHDERIELRIPGAVRSSKNLRWRLELISYFMLASKDEELSDAWMREQLKTGGYVRMMMERVYCKNGDPVADPNGEERVREKIRLYTEFKKYFFTGQPVNKSIHQYLRHAPDVPAEIRDQIAEEADFDTIEF